MTKFSARKFQFKLLKEVIKISHRITFRTVRTNSWLTQHPLLGGLFLLFCNRKTTSESPFTMGGCIFHLISYFRLMTFTARCSDRILFGVRTHALARAHTHTGWAWSPTHLQKFCVWVCVCVCVCRLFIYVPCIKAKHYFSVFQMLFIGTPTLGEQKIRVPRGTSITIYTVMV
jgi:hypothetical protein